MDYYDKLIEIFKSPVKKWDYNAARCYAVCPYCKEDFYVEPSGLRKFKHCPLCGKELKNHD